MRRGDDRGVQECDLNISKAGDRPKTPFLFPPFQGGAGAVPGKARRGENFPSLRLSPSLVLPQRGRKMGFMEQSQIHPAKKPDGCDSRPFFKVVNISDL